MSKKIRSNAQTVQSENQGTEATQSAPEPKVDVTRNPDGTARYAEVFKYEAKNSKAVAAKQEFDPAWAKRDYLFTAGSAPKGSGNSVMSRIHALVGGHKDSDGNVQPILGRELAVMVRHYDFPNRGRSKYIATGIPAVGWAEGYLDGAVTKGFLKVEKPVVVKAEATEAAGESTAA